MATYPRMRRSPPRCRTTGTRSHVVDAFLADTDMDHLDENPAGGAHTLRRLVVHMIEEYARHCGHADLLREAIDGVTGD